MNCFGGFFCVNFTFFWDKFYPVHLSTKRLAYNFLCHYRYFVDTIDTWKKAYIFPRFIFWVSCMHFLFLVYSNMKNSKHNNLKKITQWTLIYLHLDKAIVNIFHICYIFIYVYREIFSNIHNIIIIPRKKFNYQIL